MQNVRKNNIKELRKQKQISQTDMAKQLGIRQNRLSLYENGYREPDLNMARQIANYFNMTIEEVFFDKSHGA